MAFSEPEKNINQLDLKEGMHVADFGAGSGFYAVAIAKRVGDSGRVYAIDVQKDLLTALLNKAKSEGLFNIQNIWGDIDEIGGSSLADKSVDACVVSNVLFQSENRANLIKEVSRILKPKGQVLAIDWSDSYGGLGPTPSSVIKKEDAQNFFVESGFLIEKSFDAGDHHWGLVFRKI